MAEGWLLGGTTPQDYRLDSDAVIKHGPGPSTRLRASKDPGKESGALLVRVIPAAPYLGKRIRFSSLVKTDAVTGRAGLWMNIDCQGGKRGPHDEMGNRAIQGSTEWARHEVVLDVPREAQDVSFGASQTGPGTTWLDEYTLEVVNETVSTTVLPPRDRAAFCAAHATQCWLSRSAVIARGSLLALGTRELG